MAARRESELQVHWKPLRVSRVLVAPSRASEKRVNASHGAGRLPGPTDRVLVIYEVSKSSRRRLRA